MANRTIHVTLAPGHVVSLASDAPDIGSLVKTIVEIREEFDPAHVRVSSNFEGFDEKSFQELISYKPRLWKQSGEEALLAKLKEGDNTHVDIAKRRLENWQKKKP